MASPTYQRAQTKEQDKTPEEELNKVKVSNLLDKQFKVMTIKMLSELGRRLDEHSEKFNRVKIYKEEPSRAEEYNNGNKKYIRKNQSINSYYPRQSTDSMQSLSK